MAVHQVASTPAGIHSASNQRNPRVTEAEHLFPDWGILVCACVLLRLHHSGAPPAAGTADPNQDTGHPVHSHQSDHRKPFCFSTGHFSLPMQFCKYAAYFFGATIYWNVITVKTIWFWYIIKCTLLLYRMWYTTDLNIPLKKDPLRSETCKASTPGMYSGLPYQHVHCLLSMTCMLGSLLRAFIQFFVIVYTFSMWYSCLLLFHNKIFCTFLPTWSVSCQIHEGLCFVP